MASTTQRDLPGKTMMKMNRACVVGGTGFVASSLVKLLLENGYAVNTTVRDPDSEQKTSHLKALQNLGDLKILRADLTDEGSFDAAVEACDFVFLVATPVDFASQDPEVSRQMNTMKLPKVRLKI